MTIEELQSLTVSTLNNRKPFDVRFSAEEAGHILTLLTKGSARKKVRLVCFTNEGSDGEIYGHACIRRKDGSVPRKKAIRRIYQRGVYLGFIVRPPESLAFIRACMEASVEVDHILTRVVERG